MDYEVLDSLIENVNNNIFQDDIIDYTINIIIDNIYQIDNHYLMNLLIKNISNENFVINFLDKFLLKTHTLKNMLFSQNLSINNIKNLLLLENINDKFYFDLYFLKDLSLDDKNDLLEYIYSIGKLDNIINSTKKYSNGIKIINIDKYIITNLKCYINLFIKYQTDKETFLKVRDFINYYITYIIYIYIDTKNIMNYLVYNNINNTFIINFINIDTVKYFVDFFQTENNYNYLYFDKLNILNQILYLKYLIKFNNNNIDNIIYLLSPLIDYNCNLIQPSFTKLNKHHKYDLFYDIANIINDMKSNYVPENMIDIILNFLNIDFLTWININEFIKICELIFKILIKIEKYDKLFNLINKNYDDFLYKLISIENEILNNFELQINKEINFSNYSSIKIILYDYINILNIISHFTIEFVKKLNEDKPFKIYGDLIYMLNLQVNKYILLTENNNINKYSLNLLIRNIIITKFIMINNQIDINRFNYYGLEYDKIINYYNNIKFNISHDFIDKIEKIKNDNLINDDYDDNLFCVKIKNKYRLPSQLDFFERDMIRLLIREKEEDPFTRQPLTLKELDEYNESN